MKRVSIAIAISIAVALGIVAAGQKEGKTHRADYFCSGDCQSYEVVEAESIDELKDHVKQGLDKAGWRPQGGIVYNAETKRYLQVMVHPRTLPSYP